jgi:serine/threonine protein kinase
MVWDIGLGWSYPSDIWSVGCILAELFTGELLFGTHEDLEHLALMEHVLSKKLPSSVTRAALRPFASSSRGAAKNGRDSSRSESHRNDHSSSGTSGTSSTTGSRTGGGRKRARDDDGTDGETNGDDSNGKRKKRARSGSGIRADDLLHTSDGRLRWPENASSKQSLKHVQKAKKLEVHHCPFCLPSIITLIC